MPVDVELGVTVTTAESVAVCDVVPVIVFVLLGV